MTVNELRFYGPEPNLTEAANKIDIIRMFNWYNQNCEVEDSKNYTIEYITNNFKVDLDTIQSLQKVPDWEYGHSGWISRQLLLGNKPPKQLLTTLNEKISAIKKLAVNIKVELVNKKTDVPIVQKPVKPSPKDDDNTLSYKILGILYDQYMGETLESKEKRNNFNIKNIVSKATKANLEVVRKSISDHEKELSIYFGGLPDPSKMDEYDQIKEYYSNIKDKKGLKERLTFLTKVLLELDNYIKTNDWNSNTNDKVEQKRKPKDKTAFKQTKKIKYKIEDDKYKIRSLSPTEIVNVNQIWIFNTKTRKLGVLTALDGKVLTMTGTTIVDFDPEKSFYKTLRKPDDVLPKVKSETKPNLKKLMDGINSTRSTISGRINMDILLLRSFK